MLGIDFKLIPIFYSYLIIRLEATLVVTLKDINRKKITSCYLMELDK